MYTFNYVPFIIDSAKTMIYNENKIIFFQDVYHWIFSQPDSPASFEITTSYPRRVLYPCRDISTLSDAGLTHREVLHVNDLDD